MNCFKEYTEDDYQDWGGKVGASELKQIKMNKIKELFMKVSGWLLWSSANSDKISLTLKAGIPFLVLWGISDTATLNELVGSIGHVIFLAAQTFSGLIALFGLMRKIVLSLG